MQNLASPPSLAKPNSPKNRFGPQSKNLASIIRGFKIGVTKNARQINPDFAWQPRYHDHIIRNKKDHQDKSIKQLFSYLKQLLQERDNHRNRIGFKTSRTKNDKVFLINISM